MKPHKALIAVLILSIAGMLFSGYLTYGELFKGSCETNFVRCGTWSFADLPACVYGFVMYLIVFVFALLGILGGRKQQAPLEIK